MFRTSKRTRGRVLGAAILTAPILAASHASPASAGHCPEGVHAILNEASGKVLDVPWPSQDWGTPIQQWDLLGTPERAPNQWFRISDNWSGSTCVIRSVYNGLSLDIAWASHADGAPVIQWPFGADKPHRKYNQEWILERVDHQFFRIRSRESGKYLGIRPHWHFNGDKVQQYSRNDSREQLWRLIG